MRIEPQNHFEGVGGSIPQRQTIKAEPELTVRIDVIGILGGDCEVGFYCLLGTAQLQLQISAQNVEIGVKFASRRERVQSLLQTALGAQCQGDWDRIVNGRSSGVHGSDATAVRVTWLLMNVKPRAK